jgi:hypothetical protein
MSGFYRLNNLLKEVMVHIFQPAKTAIGMSLPNGDVPG